MSYLAAISSRKTTSGPIQTLAMATLRLFLHVITAAFADICSDDARPRVHVKLLTTHRHAQTSLDSLPSLFKLFFFVVFFFEGTLFRRVQTGVHCLGYPVLC